MAKKAIPAGNGAGTYELTYTDSDGRFQTHTFEEVLDLHDLVQAILTAGFHVDNKVLLPGALRCIRQVS